MKLKNKKNREKHKKIFIEGKRLIQDALSIDLQPKIIFYSRLSDIENLKLSENVRKCQVDYKQLRIWSDVATSQGVIGKYIYVFLKVNSHYTTYFYI